MRKVIGHVDVDAGLLWLGDPCYLRHGGIDWSAIVNAMGPSVTHHSFPHPNLPPDSEGKGVCVTTGYGDGTYPVVADIVDGRVKSVTIKFF